MMQRSWEKIGLIVRREYRARVRQRSFVIITVLMAVVFVLLACAPTIVQAIRNGKESTTTIAIAITDIATPAAIADEITRLDQQLRADGTGSAIALTAVNGPVGTLRDQVNRGTYQGLLILSHSPAGDPLFEYDTTSGTRDTTTARIQQAASFLAVQDRLTRAGLTQAQQSQVFAPPAFSVSATNPQTHADIQSETQKNTNRGLAYILDILLYTTIIVYGMWIASGVVEEKSNRIMEIMINAATPTQLMAGKILGIGAAALTQYLCITIPGAVALAAQGRIAHALLGTRSGATALDLTGLSVTAVIAFLGFFILGFLLYAALYAGAGSLVSRQEDVQQIAAPMQMAMIGSFFAAIFTLGKPDATVARVLAFIPFCSPLVMLTRVLVGHPAPWEVALSVAILIASIAFFVMLAARMYRIGVLLYGARPNMRTVFTLNHARVAR
ncbi:MAG: ABC transporter permease [Chloroflexota bacterium]|nr:ABC transporter permease [Chloroflexota bacterium]